MRKGFLLSRHEREPEARSAPSKAEAVVDKTAAPMSIRRDPERGFSAAEHEVFCLVASPLALFAGEAPVLNLCRVQERTLFYIALHIEAVREGVAMLPLPSPVKLLLIKRLDPSPFLVERMRSSNMLLLTKLFFMIWVTTCGGGEARYL